MRYRNVCRGVGETFRHLDVAQIVRQGGTLTPRGGIATQMWCRLSVEGGYRYLNVVQIVGQGEALLLLLAKTNESTQVCVPVQQTKLIQHTDDLNHKDMRIHSSKKSGLPVPRRKKKQKAGRCIIIASVLIITISHQLQVSIIREKSMAIN